MQQFKGGGLQQNRKEVYDKYKQILKVSAQQVARKNAESWRGFFSLIRGRANYPGGS